MKTKIAHSDIMTRLSDIKKIKILREENPSLDNKPFYEVEPMRDLASLSLSSTTRNTCRNLIEEQNESNTLRSHNLEPRHRVILWGPPGNGKATLAESLAYEMKVPFFVVRYDTLIAEHPGKTMSQIFRLLFQLQNQRCVVLFGDLGIHEEIKQVINSLSSSFFLDNIGSNIVIVIATSRPEIIDNVIWNKFEIKLELPPPNEEYFDRWLLKIEKANHHPSPNTIECYKKASFAELNQVELRLQRAKLLNHQFNSRDILVKASDFMNKKYDSKRGEKAGL